MEFWEQGDVVAEFAARAPDHRLVSLIEDYRDPGRVRVLDVGCAGGRNTVLLAARGFDVYALDASSAMVAETRRRVGGLLGEREAALRVRHGRMSELPWPDDHFALVVALGVLHSAASWSEWQQSAAELARVLQPGGTLLVAAFTPETDLTGEGLQPVPGEPHGFDGLPGGRATLLSAPELDGALARFDLVPVTPTAIGTTVTERGRRVSANGYYRLG